MSATDTTDWPGHPDADPDCECCLGDGLQADGETPCPCIDARKGYRAAQAASLTPDGLIDLIGEFGREVCCMLDDCETSGPVGEEVHTITDESLTKVSAILDRIDALPFEEPGVILGTGAMLQAAIKQTFQTYLPQPSVSVAGATETPCAWLDVMGERVRQITAEGWTADHDDAHSLGQMAGAALCYLAEDIPHWARQQAHGCYWPWDAGWWKPDDHRRNLVKAGALILAEIERLDRAADKEGQPQ